MAVNQAVPLELGTEKPFHYLPEPILRMGVIEAFLSRFHGGE